MIEETDWLKQKVKLGQTELFAGRLGLAGAYGAPAEAYEYAFEAGCNYFYWGALRNAKMATAIRNIIAHGKREELIIVIQDFQRTRRGVEKSLMRGLKKLGLDYADVLLLGWHKKPPKPKTIEAVTKLQEKGAFRYLGISGHHRPLFAELAHNPSYEIMHIRYNAAHRGAETDVFSLFPEQHPGIIVFNATKHKALMNSKRIPPDIKRPTAGDCYRFALAHPCVDVVITGPSNLNHIQENLAEVVKGPMSETELAWMRQVGDFVYGKK